MKSYFDLTGRVAVVTGCSTGLGVQMAKALANQGCKIVGIARRKEMVEKVAKDIADTYKVEAIGISCDITDTARIETVVDEVMAKFGRIDILVNNAGTGTVGAAEQLTDDKFFSDFNIDVHGSFRMARTIAVKAMIPAKYGRIINIASMYGLVGNKICPCASYHAAKGAVVNMTRGLAAEWGKYGISVNAICPGYFYSDLTTETLNSEMFQNYARTMIPLSRYGKEGELDSAVIFLASPFSTYVTGVILPVDGGYTCM